jgi:hypothetical protein
MIFVGVRMQGAEMQRADEKNRPLQDRSDLSRRDVSYKRRSRSCGDIRAHRKGAKNADEFAAQAEWTAAMSFGVLTTGH